MACIDEMLHGNLQLLGAMKLKNGVDLIAAGGSILDYEGDCMVNAANTGGITGFGLDELVNRKAGNAMKEARRKFNGIPTGSAKSTPGFNHTAVKWVIHATGPVFRENALSKESVEEKYRLLYNAYRNALEEASNLGCEDIGFCLLSCGVFRGEESLEYLIKLGLKAVSKGISESPTIQKVVFVAYTQEEQEALKVQVDGPNQSAE